MNTFRVIIAGGRNFNDFNKLTEIMDSWLRFKKETHKIIIVSGGAKGADALGEMYANLRGYEITQYKANWDKYGKRAGYLRNEIMACNADALAAFWDGQSKGTDHMIKIAAKYNLPTKIFIYEKIN
jgi:hypothetical protein